MAKHPVINTIKVMDMHIHENTLFKFTSDGMTISTGVNVSEIVAHVLTYGNLGVKGKVFMGEKRMQIYKKARHIPAIYICEETVYHVQRELLKECQIDVKLAKNKLS